MNLQCISGKIRFVKGSKGGLLLLLIISAEGEWKFSRLSASDSPKRPDASLSTESNSGFGDHPYIESTDLKPETCLTCHPTKTQGKFVHTALGQGCEGCHQVSSRDGQTAITLRAAGLNLCAKCHEIKSAAVRHGPYAAGECLICHNPHSAAYPAETRAAVSTLCLSCHMPNQPAATPLAGGKAVSLFDGMTYDFGAWQRAPKITARHVETVTRAAENEAAADKKAPRRDEEPTCLTCHDPHASTADHLLRGCKSGNLDFGYVPDHQGSYRRGQL
jgi:predicted CXXCH cytochrome family protein